MNSFVRSSSNNSEETAFTQIQKMKDERERRATEAKRRRDECSKLTDIQIRKKKRELKAEANDDFKCQALRTSLETSQMKATMFHSFTTAFCGMNHQPPPPPLQLPSIPVPETIEIVK